MPFITINSNRFPFLVFGDADRPMPWHHGTIYSLRLKSTFLRFTQRGMQYSQSPAPPVMRADLWQSAPCAPTHDGLCALAASAGSMVWFPTTKVDIPDDFAIIPPNTYLDGFANGSACSSAHTGRAVKMFDERYEVSLCDLLDSSLDVVFDYGCSPDLQEPCGHGTVYWRRDTTSVWVYCVISVLCIYLTSCVSDNIVSMVHNAPCIRHRSQIFSVCATVALVVYLLFVQDTSALLLTREDQELSWHLFAYVLVQTAAQLTDPGDDMHGSRISLLTACIALLTLRVHYSFGTLRRASLTCVIW